MTPEQIKALVEATVAASVPASVAAVRDTQTEDASQQLAGLRLSSKKVELPKFDKQNIDIWIKRMESAFVRANVTKPKDKFAHLESILDVNIDPVITNVH